MRSRIFSIVANLFLLTASVVLIGADIFNEDHLSGYADKIEWNEEGKKDHKEEQKHRKLHEFDLKEFKYHHSLIWSVSFNQHYSLTVNSLCYLEIQTPPPEWLA